MATNSEGVRRYQWVAWTGITMLLVDLCINSSFLVFCQSTLTSLLVYIIQDVCLVFSVILLAVATVSTSLLKVGLVSEAAGRLKWSGMGVLTYLALSIAFHTVSLQQQWEHTDQQYLWTDPMLAFFSIHKIAAAMHYYLYKRALFRLSDQKYYL